jgi:hypothetical protein
VGFALYLPPLSPLPGLDTVAIGFSASGMFILLGVWRFRLLDLAPVARDVLVEKMADGLLVLDTKGRIVDLNPVAREWFGLPDRAVGMPFAEAFPAWAERLTAAEAQPSLVLEVAHPVKAALFYDLRVSTLHTRRGTKAGSLLVVRDVTARRRVEQERERLITELQEALLDIRTLRGLLPICSSCKKIRDDSGYWRHLEDYVSAHSEAQFSHGLCPDCARRLYPDLVDDAPREPR